jgi:hypothetical protein
MRRFFRSTDVLVRSLRKPEKFAPRNDASLGCHNFGNNAELKWEIRFTACLA